MGTQPGTALRATFSGARSGGHHAIEPIVRIGTLARDPLIPDDRCAAIQ